MMGKGPFSDLIVCFFGCSSDRNALNEVQSALHRLDDRFDFVTDSTDEAGFAVIAGNDSDVLREIEKALQDGCIPVVGENSQLPAGFPREWVWRTPDEAAEKIVRMRMSPETYAENRRICAEQFDSLRNVGVWSGEEEDGVSVIIPTYRDNPYVKEAVVSVLNQTYPKEKLDVLLCVNGPDRDYYRSLKSQYDGNAQVRVLYTPAPGLNCGRNLGVRNAHRKFFTFLDDDDALTPGYLDLMVGLLTDPGNHIAIGRTIDKDESSGRVNRETWANVKLRKLGARGIKDYYRLGVLLSTLCGKVFRRSFFVENFFPLDEEEKRAEDILFWAEHFHRLQGEIVLADAGGDEGYVRRLSSDSLSRPNGARSYSFWIEDGLRMIGRLANSLTDPRFNLRHKQFILLKLNVQVSMLLKYFKGLDGELRDRARKAIFSSKSLFLNKSLFSDRVALAFCHNFPPFADASAFVASRRLEEIDEIEGGPLQWRVLAQDLRSKRTSDPEYSRFFADLKIAKYTCIEGPVGFAPREQLGYARQAFRRVKDIDAAVIYSRSVFVGSHMAADMYKKAHPQVKWYAEFSDPLGSGVDGKVRACKGTPTWFDIEEMVYRGADVIIFTNRNQLEYMLSYNPHPELNESVRRRARVMRHPVLPHAYCGLHPSGYRLDADRINIGFFGTFYANRSADDLLTLLSNHKVVLHIFTPKPEQLRLRLSIYGSQIRVNDVIGCFEFLNLGARMDYLILTDAVFPGKINPYLPSKYADYLATGTRILALVQKGSVLSEENHPRLLKFERFTEEMAGALTERNCLK